jgi:UDP-glucose 4-epimerase
MKKILITGANSYVGTNVEKWLMKEPEKYYVETLEMKNPNWKDFDFSKFDVVFHVAGIAHVSTNKKYKNLYFKVNRDLAFDVALKAKNVSVTTFVFMSSMIVYNSNEEMISNDTLPNPSNFYGESKLQAELLIKKLETDSFKVAILRPPMIYGKNSLGNFKKLMQFSKNSLLFPKIENKRSILYIDNLSIFVKKIIDENKSGTFRPRNIENISTTDIYKEIRILIDKKYILLPLLKKIMKILMPKKTYNKIFGSYYYSDGDFDSSFTNFSDSISMIIK